MNIGVAILSTYYEIPSLTYEQGSFFIDTKKQYQRLHNKYFRRFLFGIRNNRLEYRTEDDTCKQFCLWTCIAFIIILCAAYVEVYISIKMI